MFMVWLVAEELGAVGVCFGPAEPKSLFFGQVLSFTRFKSHM